MSWCFESNDLSMDGLYALNRGDRAISVEKMLRYASIYERAGLDGSKRLEHWLTIRKRYVERMLQRVSDRLEELSYLQIRLKELSDDPAYPGYYPRSLYTVPECVSCGQEGHSSWDDPSPEDSTCPARDSWHAWSRRGWATTGFRQWREWYKTEHGAYPEPVGDDNDPQTGTGTEGPGRT